MRIQKLAQPLWIGEEIDLHDPHTYVHFWYEGKFNRKCVDSPETAKAFLDRCTARNVGGFASTLIPMTGQHGVFYFSLGGCTKECALRKNDNAKVMMAYKSVFNVVEVAPVNKPDTVQIIKKTEDKPTVKPAQKEIKKDDPVSIVCFVTFDGCATLYAYRCNEWHTVNEKVVVFSIKHNDYENVTIHHCELMTESEIITYAKSKGYDDLDSVYSDNYGYIENIAELQAMKECFTPASDVVYNGDLPDVTDEYPEGYDYGDLPE